MLTGVLGVEDSISGDIMSIWFHISHYSEREAQMGPYCSLESRNFNRTKQLSSVTKIGNIYSNSHILDHCDTFGSHLVWYEEIYTSGLSKPKSQERKYVCIHVVSIYIIYDLGRACEEQCVFCWDVSFILL